MVTYIFSTFLNPLKELNGEPKSFCTQSSEHETNQAGNSLEVVVKKPNTVYPFAAKKTLRPVVKNNCYTFH
jgi:hypothetical protein